MPIRFVPFWLGIALGRLIYTLIEAFMNGAEESIQWRYELLAACCVGFITACLYAVVMAIVETKRYGAAKVRLW